MRLGRRSAVPGLGAAPRRQGRGRAAVSDPVAAAVAEVARAMAGTGMRDGEARAELAQALPDDPAPLRAAVTELARRRDSYLEDRAYRLLAAAVDGGAVPDIEPLRRSLFLKEKGLGRMSLGDGFAHLALLEPRLREVVGGDDGALVRVVGPKARSRHQIVRTVLAAQVVREYIRVTDGGRQAAIDPTPYFERPMH